MNILITGCSTGIGYFCAKELHKNGFNVYATYRNEKDIVRLQNEGLNTFVLDLNDSKNLDWITRRAS